MLERAQNELCLQIEQTLRPYLASARRICLLDPPSHPNVGDSAILLGEIQLIRSVCPDAQLSFYDCETYSPEADRFIAGADLLLLHGGGNFGDLWPHHHEFRLRVLERFPDRKLVQLPQSISFGDEGGTLARTRSLVDRHRDFTLLLRDRKSLAFARAAFDCPTVLAPDMAFAMPPIRRLEPAIDCLCLLRTDKERVADHAAILDAVGKTGRTFASADWLDERPSLLPRADRVLRRLTRRSPALLRPAMDLALAVRRRYAAERLAHGIALLSRGRTVVADRLHAMILAALLDIPCAALDSADGKISALHDAWLQDRPDVRMVADAAGLPRVLDELRAG